MSDEFIDAVAELDGVLPSEFREAGYRSPTTVWLYHPTDGPWAEASRRFADGARGDVRVVAPNATPDRVFAATELPRILANEQVTSLEGLPRPMLAQVYAREGQQAAFEMVAAQSHANMTALRVGVNYAGTLLRDEYGRVQLDSRAYFQDGPVQGRAPSIGSTSRDLGMLAGPPTAHVQAGYARVQTWRLDVMPDASIGPALGTAKLARAGAIALGAAATAYDIADTGHDVGRLRAQGNASAAEDRITRFATQNLGGWGGATAGMAAGAVAGVETGPGLLLSGAVGGVIGAVAGDRVADWIGDYKINNQQDGQGNTWSFNPARPEQGWARTLPPLPEFPQGQRLSASPELSDELTWKASRRSIELALGAPPQNRDPYRLPVEAAEAGQRKPFETERAWTRTPQSGQWQQEIRELLDGRVPLTRHEPVRPEQAEVLEQRSHAIITENAQRTPAAMAARFQAAYAHNGWAQHSSLPEAVTHALRHPGRVVGSDGDLYERDAQGQWTHDGMFRDRRAEGSLLHELEATYQTQQRAALPITTLDPVQVRPDPVLEHSPATLQLNEPQAATHSNFVQRLLEQAKQGNGAAINATAHDYLNGDAGQSWLQQGQKQLLEMEQTKQVIAPTAAEIER